MIASIAPYFDESEDTYTLPYIVIIIDEFADLILSKHGKEIEYNVCRLAAKARAAGVHLIVATQRPSVDVITGLIKSNFPTRVSFKVTSAIDSRTILNAMGAEKLLGKGDMLFKNGVEMVRIHSAYIEEAEIEQLNAQLKDIKPHFNQKVLDFFAREGREAQEKTEEKSYNSFFGPQDSEDDEDALYEQAVAVVHEYRMASASMLQRRLRIGYNRAANLIDLMEERGVVGPAQGSRPRQVLGVSSDSTMEQS
jgi:S-DNA-T family DNA segregation ATPase FtsK/SpoIIIE